MRVYTHTCVQRRELVGDVWPCRYRPISMEIRVSEFKSRIERERGNFRLSQTFLI